MGYLACLVVCGLAWGGVSLGLLDYVSPAATMIASVATALIVGLVQKNGLRQAKGSMWYVLPLLSVAIAMVVYGVLEPAAEWVIGGQTWNSNRVEISAFWSYPPAFLWYGLTLFIWLTYPLALGTHFLLREFVPPAPTRNKRQANRSR